MLDGHLRLPHLSNATDFRLVTWADWIAAPSASDYDFIILPGSKNTIADLQWLRSVGLADWILARHRAGARVIGICGGFQMLGRQIDDPTGIESDLKSAPGLGLIPSTTTLTPEKTTRAVRASLPSGVTFGGYEIHVGVTDVHPDTPISTFAMLEDGTAGGSRGDRVIETYLHGPRERGGLRDVFGMSMPRHARQGRALSAARALVRATRPPSGPRGSTDHDDIDTQTWECLRHGTALRTSAGRAAISSRNSTEFIR